MRLVSLAFHPHAEPILVLALLLVAGPKQVQAQEKPITTPRPGVKFQADIVYGTGAGQELMLNLAWPEKSDGPLPCIVVIHGGAWRAGDRAGHNNMTWDFAQRGYVSATLGYRFCPAQPFPAQVEDVKCAVRYLRAHAEKYGIDKNRFGAVGFSAGAHLSMMLGTLDPADGLEGMGGWPDQSSKVAVVVSFVGPVDLAATDLPDVSKGLVKDFIGGGPDEAAARYRQASPVTHISAGDAPMLLYFGTADPLIPYTQASRMADAMTKVGAKGRVEMLIGEGHGWGGPAMERTIRDMNGFFDMYLKMGGK